MGEGLSRHIRARGLRFHVRHWAHAGAPPLVLLHGWLDLSATFAPVCARLAEHFEVFAPDARGFGHSEWPADGYWFHDYLADLEAQLDALGLNRPVHLVGHSMGAQIVSLYAGLRPARVARLALLDGLLMPDMAPSQAPRRFSNWLDQIKAPPREKTYASFQELAQRTQKLHPQISDEKALFIARCWGAEDGHGRIKLLADPKHRLDMPALYRAAESQEIWNLVTAPTLFIDAETSPLHRFLKPEEKALRHACFRDRREMVLPGAGHMLHFDQPQALAEALIGFLRE